MEDKKLLMGIIDRLRDELKTALNTVTKLAHANAQAVQIAAYKVEAEAHVAKAEIVAKREDVEGRLGLLVRELQRLGYEPIYWAEDEPGAVAAHWDLRPPSPGGPR